MIHHIVIYPSEIIHDLDFDTLFLQKVRFLGKDGVIGEHIFSNDESNAYRIARWMNKYVNKVKSYLAAYLVKYADKTNAVNIPENPTEFDFDLNMPPTWVASDDDLASTIHDYIVDGIEYQFYNDSLGPADPETKIKFDALCDEQQEIQVLLSKRSVALKVPFHPF